MSQLSLTELDLEEASLSWLASLGYTSIFGPEIAPDEPAAERVSFLDVLLIRRLQDALSRLNPTSEPLHQTVPMPGLHTDFVGLALLVRLTPADDLGVAVR